MPPIRDTDSRPSINPAAAMLAAPQDLSSAPSSAGRAAPSQDLAADILHNLRLAIRAAPETATLRDWYIATAMALRDRAGERWAASDEAALKHGAKSVYYLSMEFLIGRLMTDIAGNLGLIEDIRAALAEHGQDFDAVRNVERDAALGSGGLGRLAACYMEAMASTGVRGMGYGIRYEQGMLKQGLKDGWQQDLADDWLKEAGNPWEVKRRDVLFTVGFGGWVEDMGDGRAAWRPGEMIEAMAFDTPIVGWRGHHVATLRLWSARAVDPMRLDAFNRGDYAGAFAEQSSAAAVSQVLYPDDSTDAGKALRLKQEFFFTSASLQDLIKRHLSERGSLDSLPDHAAIQLNDTHPALAVAELVRILVDEHGYGLANAFELTRATLHYTNHTLLPEALETWPHALFTQLLPRHMQIVNDINALHLASLPADLAHDGAYRQAVSLIDETHGRRVRMGHLAFLGSNKVNGVSGLHGDLMKETVFADLHALFPDRITHVTNGITFRRWLLQCNPGLTALLRETIGDAFMDESEQLQALLPYASDPAFQDRYAAVKLANKQRLAAGIEDRIGVRVDPAAMFDVQIKRIHEYKRQQLNILETIAHYRAIKANPSADWTPRVKIFAGKSAASYHRAKLIIKLINDVAAVVNTDPEVGDRLKVAFLPNYSVSLAELIIPAADLSEQISTAGMEASGTGNMKLALNGAITIGTLDGANVEIRNLAGDENVLIFGLTADEVTAERARGHNPAARVSRSPLLADAVAALRSGEFSDGDQHRFAPLADDLMNSDFFMVTADFDAYAATQRKADEIYKNRPEWLRMCINNTAKMGWFAADRAIREYARDIWKAI